MQRDRELKSPDILIHLWYSHVYTVHSFRSHVFVITLVISYLMYVLLLCVRVRVRTDVHVSAPQVCLVAMKVRRKLGSPGSGVDGGL